MGVLNPTHCVWCPLWAGGPGSLKARCISHAEQASSMVSTWALDSGFLPCWSCFSDFSWWWAIMWKCKWIKPFHPQVVYYHGVSSQQWELQVRQKMQLIDKWAWLLCYKNLYKAVCIDYSALRRTSLSPGKVLSQSWKRYSLIPEEYSMEGGKAIEVIQPTEGQGRRWRNDCQELSFECHRSSTPYTPHFTSQ